MLAQTRFFANLCPANGSLGSQVGDYPFISTRQLIVPPTSYTQTCQCHASSIIRRHIMSHHFTLPRTPSSCTALRSSTLAFSSPILGAGTKHSNVFLGQAGKLQLERKHAKRSKSLSDEDGRMTSTPQMRRMRPDSLGSLLKLQSV